MCPACIASAALIGGSVVSTGGLTALVVRMVRPTKHIQGGESIIPPERKNNNGNDERENNRPSNENK
jgi:hypothetical protein